jgi:hypothetical protein
MGSHLLGDACTRGGIQPLLPLINWRFWLLPRIVRGRSDGRINALAGAISTVMLALGIAWYVLTPR